MPSLFSRSRTQSTPHKASPVPPPPPDPPSLDEFGRVPSRTNTNTPTHRPFAITVSTPSKKDKKKAKDQAKRSKTLGVARFASDNNQWDADSDHHQQALPDGSFLPLNLDPPQSKHAAALSDPSSPAIGNNNSSDQPPPRQSQPGAGAATTTDYGYLSYQRHVVLGLDQLSVLITTLADQLESRGGLTTPFIFANTALDISAPAIKRLIRSFLAMCAAQGTSMGFADAERAWKDEAKFAAPHELGMCLRWGLARVVRVYAGQDVRGLISWEHYVQFRDSEAALGYPPAHFETILHDLDTTLQSIIVRLLFLLTRLTANSTSSGHTPPTLSPLFGPLLFGLGPATLAFHHAYIHYLRAVNATEHLILAFIRWQDTPRLGVPQHQQHQQQQQAIGSAAGLGVPIRLKEWIKGYPAMLPSYPSSSSPPHKNHPHTHNHGNNHNTNHLNNISMAKPHPRKGAKTVTLTTVRRNVRMYSPDLVRTASTWAHNHHHPHLNNHGSKSVSSSSATMGVVNGLANSKEWDRIAPATLKLSPRYSEGYKKRMNMLPGVNPDVGPGNAMMSPSSSMVSSASTGSRTGGIGGTMTTSGSAPTIRGGPLQNTRSASGAGGEKDYFGLGLGNKREGEDRFRSLTDLKWGEFESMGFGSGSLGVGGEGEKKLQFDLTESAREERAAKRQTMSWTDFSTSGFTRTDAPLNATLQFSTPLALSLSQWPARDAELTKKIKKQEKQLPPFGWDTEPVMGNEEVVEEAFVDVFCDLIYGGGWMDLERSEGLDRDVNWAIVEYKSLPPNRSTITPGGTDPRAHTTLILFEEFVPLEYRQQLSVKSTTRRRLPALFSPSKKQWKQAATLNGRPYVVGHVPRSPSYREMEFEGLLQGSGGTKVISLGSKASTRVVSTISSVAPPSEAGGGVPRSPPPPVPPLPASVLGASTSGSHPSTTTTANVLSPLTIPSRLTQAHAPKSDASHSDSTATAPASSTASPSVVQKKSSSSRFKITNVISVVPSPKRLSMVPAEYSVVDFDTRLASYSDSERNSGGGGPGGNGGGGYDDTPSKSSKKKKRESKDDAWVDILVNSASRRMVGQDVDPGVLKTPERKTNISSAVTGGGDPDMASMEVAQVLAAVRRDRQRSPSLGSSSSAAGGIGGDEDEEEDFVPHSQPGIGVDMDAHVQGLEIDEIERVPRRVSVDSGGRAYEGDEEEDEDSVDEDDDDDDDDDLEERDRSLGNQQQGEGEPQSEVLLSVRHALKQQRRLGYFDVHPERKKLYDAEAAEDMEERDVSPHQKSLSPDLPPFDANVEKKRAEAESKAGLTRADSATLPFPPVQANGNGHTPPAATATAQQPSAHPIGPRAPAGAGAASAPVGTKTAALIEMYRERERRAGSTSPAAPATAAATPAAATPATTVPPPSVPVVAPIPVAGTPIIAPLRPQRPAAGAPVLPGATNANAAIDVPAAAAAEEPTEPVDITAPGYIEPPRIVLEETGRASPARYVHGAPLHNVLEEEEEE